MTLKNREYARATRLAVGLFLFTSLAATAHADDEGEARALYQKGNLAFSKGDDVMAREHYRASWSLNESFDTICNLGRAQYRSKLYAESYESLSYCVHMYPRDPELDKSRERFVSLRGDVRSQIEFEQADAADKRVQAHFQDKEANAPDSGLVEEDPKGGASRGQSWKLPVVIGAGSLGAIGIGVGVGALVHSNAKKGDADDLREDLADADQSCGGNTPPDKCEELLDALKASDSASTVGVVSLAAGGALAAGALLAYFLWPEPASVDVAGLSLQRPLPLVTYDKKSAAWQFGFSTQF